MRGGSWRAMAMAVAASAAVGFTYLKGSREKMVRQNTVAHEDHYEFAQTPADIAQMVMAHKLVALPGSADYSTKGVSFAFARPEVLYFVERLAYDYHRACGQPLVVTSLVRPISLQPRGASPLSVHPAGMAVDLHIPDQPACRTWLVNRLLTLASYNVLDVTQEHHPPHLHVAVFPRAYMVWVAGQPALPVMTPGRLVAGGPVPAQSATSLAAVDEAGEAAAPGRSRRAAEFGTTAAGAIALMGLAGVVLVRPRRGSRSGAPDEAPPGSSGPTDGGPRGA